MPFGSATASATLTGASPGGSMCFGEIGEKAVANPSLATIVSDASSFECDSTATTSHDSDGATS
eukprot:1932513-Lingulodinium_polyedra.AAC.1